MRRRCAPPDRPRQVNDDVTTAQVRDLFAAYRTDPQAVWAMPTMADTDPPPRLGITTIGGDRLGRTYANNDWIYGLWLGDRLHRCGTDLHCGAIGKTHHQMAVLLGEYLAADESLDEQTRRRLAAWSSRQHVGPDRPDA